MSVTSARAQADSTATRNPGRLDPDFSERSAQSRVIRLRTLWRERRFLGRALWLGLILGIALAFLLPKQYQSSVQLMPPDSQSGSGLLMALAGGGSSSGLGALASGLLGNRNTGEQFVAILHSRTLQDRLVKRFDLKKIYRTRFDVDARKELADDTTIETDRKSGVISVLVSDREPDRARELARAYLDELDRLVAELSTSSARRERIFLEGRLQAVKQDLDQAARNFSQFASTNGAIDITEQGKAMVGAAAVLQGQSIAVESELKGLEQIYSPNNVRVRSARARLEELRRQIGKLDGPVANDSTQPADAVGASYPSIRQLPLLGVTYFDLLRKAKIQEALYEALTKEYEMAKVQEAKEIPSVKVLDPPNLPEKRSFPPRMLVLFLCLMISLVAGVSVVFIRERWVRTDSGDPGKALAREVFRSVGMTMPWAPPNGSRVQAATHKIWIKVAGKKQAVETSPQ